MRKYQLQVKLTSEKVIDLDFLSIGESLIDIDQFTNQRTFYELCSLISSQVDVNQIKSFQIEVRQKPFSYSVMFKNPYLSKLFSYPSIIKKNRGISLHPLSPAYLEMKTYVFECLEKNPQNFFETYPYRNSFYSLAKKYTDRGFIDFDDAMEKDLLRRKIETELQEYRTFRSLCLYRQKNYSHSFHVSLKPERLKIHPPIVENPQYRLIPSQKTTVASVQCWYNDAGEEREEFLEEEELNEMMKRYE